MKIIYHTTRTLVTRDNGRSSDAVSPNFIYGCLGGCMKSYCYVSRYNDEKLYINTNIDDILKSISDWVNKKPWPKIPNQIDDKYYTIDIGCSTDVCLHSKIYDWQKVFDFFNEHPKLKSTFATKYPSKFQDFNINPEKNRIRISLMPQIFSDVLESHTDKIDTRISFIPILQKQLEVHLNFSPIILERNWLEEYENLFKKLKGFDFKSECIFLTYNEVQYKKNSDAVNSICWKPEFQETKNSHYAENNIRYKWQLKNRMIYHFKNLYSKYFDINTIRYIF